MSREYYDRGLPTEKLHPASTSQQHCFDITRRRFTEALAANMDEILAKFPDVAFEYTQMTTILKLNPTREFKLFRPEDASLTMDFASNSKFVR